MLNFSQYSDRQLAYTMAFVWLLLTLPAMGMVPLFDYDETIYAQTAVDMMRLGQWIVPTANGIDFFEKPPFTYYMMDLCFSIFGQNAFAARLPSAIFTLMTAALLFRFGEQRNDARLGLMAALIFLSMFEVGLLAHAAILDAVLNFFILATLLYYLRWLEDGTLKHALWCSAMMGLAVLIKGPVGVAVPVLVIILDRLLVGNLWATLKRIPWASSLLLFFICASPWYMMIGWFHGWGFLQEFIMVHNIGRALNPMQGHGGGWHYYLVVFAISVLPWLLWLPWLLRQWSRNSMDPYLHMIRFGLIWVVCVVLLFSFAQTKLPHYISCIYPALALALAAAWRRSSMDKKPSAYVSYASVALLLPLAIAMLTFPWIYSFIIEFVQHPRAIAIIQQPLEPPLSIAVAGACLLLTLIYIVWQARSTTWLLWRFVVLGLILQSTMMLPLASFAAKLAQGPTMHIAEIIHQQAPHVSIYSYNLNTPSVSFYADRNYTILLGEKGQLSLQQAEQPWLLFMRAESQADFPWLTKEQLLLKQGGFLLYSSPHDDRLQQ